MTLAARQTDTIVGTCCCHGDPPCRTTGGSIMKGSRKCIINGLPAARLTDQVLGECGHSAVIIKGSSKLFIDGLPAARLGDTISGCINGSIIKGSPNVLVNT